MDSAYIVDREQRCSQILCEVISEQNQQDILKGRGPNIQAQGGGQTTGGIALFRRGNLRWRLSRWRICLERLYMIDVVTAHRRTDRSDQKDDLVAKRE